MGDIVEIDLQCMSGYFDTNIAAEAGNEKELNYNWFSRTKQKHTTLPTRELDTEIYQSRFHYRIL